MLTVDYEFFDRQTVDSALEIVDALRRGEKPHPTRGAPLTDFRRIELLLAGFFDEPELGGAAANAGPSADAATLAGAAARRGPRLDRAADAGGRARPDDRVHDPPGRPVMTETTERDGRATSRSTAPTR